MKKINIAQIGYGYWGKRLAKYLEADKHVYLKYICDFSFKNKGKLINDAQKIWDDKSVKAIVIATPISTHYELIKKALLSGKSVLSEKPLTPKLEEIAELEKICRRKNLFVLTEFTYTFSKSLQKAVEIISSGKIGKVEAMEMSLKYAGRFLKFDVYWLLGSHLLSILDTFVSLKELNFKKVDMIKHKNRVETGVILFSKKDFTGKMTVSLNYPEKEMKVIIYGEKGTIVYSSMAEPSLKYICYKKSEGVIGSDLVTEEKSYFFDEKNNLKNAVEYFSKNLRKKAVSNIARAALVTKIIENL